MSNDERLDLCVRRFNKIKINDQLVFTGTIGCPSTKKKECGNAMKLMHEIEQKLHSDNIEYNDTLVSEICHSVKELGKIQVLIHDEF